MDIDLLSIRGTQRGDQVWMAYQWAKAIEENATPKEREELERAVTRVCKLLAPIYERASVQGQSDVPSPGDK